MLLDTSGLFCLLHRREPKHSEARKIYSAATNRSTHNYVLDELISLSLARRGSPKITLEFSQKTLDDPGIEIIWVDEALHRQAW
jgi:predicted nucleic acid-binding protein